MLTVHQDTLPHQGGLGVQSAELASEQSVPVGPRGLDRRCLRLLNHADLEHQRAAMRNNATLHSF